MADTRLPSLTEQVMAFVRRAIDTGEMVPGAWYSAYQLADVLGMSRSPVRDGLLRLEEAGLIQFTRNRGFQIVETTPADIAEYFSLRLAIEPPAAFRAARQRSSDQLENAYRLLDSLSAATSNSDAEAFFRCDQDLQELILQMGNSHRGGEFIVQHRPPSRTTDVSRPLPEIHAELRPVIDAIRARDAVAARARLHSHLVATGSLAVAQSLRRDGVAEADLTLLAARIWDEYAGGVDNAWQS